MNKIIVNYFGYNGMEFLVIVKNLCIKVIISDGIYKIKLEENPNNWNGGDLGNIDVEEKSLEEIIKDNVNSYIDEELTEELLENICKLFKIDKKEKFKFIVPNESIII